ncbi:hypothetical protein [Pontibacter harenae]|uniref:hypothetical protein n=1 Tax=Pontibacter harenae TaxID=2894083 RepID=UPI001E5DC9F2|nr:hypothetical protein [Pontibacter harenae]MCC9167282.1 hypothetical protein [Pontibacter harenae]
MKKLKVKKMQAPSTHIGIDYGSKTAGTTAIAHLSEEKLYVEQSSKGADADLWVLQQITKYNSKLIFIDAPLTLPKAYFQEPALPESNFFYRVCDIEVGAMSPMFIGGLTARAIKLRTELATKGIGMLEAYPAALNKLLFAELTGYKKSLAALPLYVEALHGLLPYNLTTIPQNWHQFDALLAWYSGFRHMQGISILYGDSREGRIIV